MYICSMFVIHPTPTTGDGAEVQHTQTTTTRVALAPPCRGVKALSLEGGGALASIVLHCLWSESQMETLFHRDSDIVVRHVFNPSESIFAENMSTAGYCLGVVD